MSTEWSNDAELFALIRRELFTSVIADTLDAHGYLNQMLPPNINFREPDPELQLNIVANETRPARLTTVLSNSFGFGGTNASILLRRAA